MFQIGIRALTLACCVHEITKEWHSMCCFILILTISRGWSNCLYDYIFDIYYTLQGGIFIITYPEKFPLIDAPKIEDVHVRALHVGILDIS